ncbi:LmeA family phospholipid-binding protein [Kitasatospora sp. NPDC002227]|uniref:LmeA family phospholipid-binding protein n=1 Tax=Kitasatospora sp. NPDC002227 TaxID=3154773 RepID=UPI00331D6BF2
MTRARGSAATRRRSRTAAVAAAAAMALLLTTAGGADLALEHVARGRIADRVDCVLHARGATAVALPDTLAGLDVLTGRVGTVDIDARDITQHDTRMNLQVRLHDVTTRGATSGGTATATIALDELRHRLPATAGTGTLGARDGDLTFTTTAGGLGLPVTVRAGVTTTDHALTVTPKALDLMGREIPVSALGSAAPAALADRLKPQTMPLPDLPAGAALASAGVGPDGLALHLSLGPDVTTRSPAPRSGCAA